MDADKDSQERVCISDVEDGRLYIGNLTAALSPDLLSSMGITHVLSVCPLTPSQLFVLKRISEHRVIDVDDNEYEEILTRFNEGSEFIDRALADGTSKVLVHCMMGVSRSASIVAAHLMKRENMDACAAIKYLKQRRPKIHPNYGFVKQLEAYKKCGFDPSPSNPAYRSWKRRNVQDVTNYLNHLEDIATIMPDKLMLSSNFPEDEQQACSMLDNIGITHLLTLSPSDIPIPEDIVKAHHHVQVSEHNADEVLDLLPEALRFIAKALSEDEHRVLVYCENEPRACLAVSAYLLAIKKINNTTEALAMIRKILPLFCAPESWDRRLAKLDQPSYREALELAVQNPMTYGEAPAEPTPAAPFEMDSMRNAISEIQQKVRERPNGVGMNHFSSLIS